MSDRPPTEPPDGSGSGTDTGGNGLPDNIEPIEIQSEMETSFLEYAMSVIISRALPDARDGLKPVHRRILWSMYDAGHRPDRQHVKCATVVGDVMAPFVGEIELGTPLSVLIERAGGLRAGRAVQAVFSGVANAVITADHLDAPVSYEGLAAAGSGMGSAGFVVYDDAVKAKRPGIIDTIKGYVAGVFGATRSKVEEVSAEVQFRTLRVVWMVVWTLAAVTSLFLALCFAMLTVIFGLGLPPRYAFGIPSLVFLVAGVVAVFMLKRTRHSRR